MRNMVNRGTKGVTFSFDSLSAIDLETVSPGELEEIRRRWFGPPLKVAMASALEVAATRAQDASAFARYLDDSRPETSTFARMLQDMRFAEAVKSAPYQQPKVPGNRVTDFTGWIYDVQLLEKNNRALMRGKDVERQVAERNGARLLPSREHPKWKIAFRDPLTSGKSCPFEITHLRVNGRALVGIPDIVYVNERTGEIVIVERKATNAIIPTNGWPNLRAQLWAYAQIDKWITAPKVTLVGEIWKMARPTELRAVLKWDARDPGLINENRWLFERYGGTVEHVS